MMSAIFLVIVFYFFEPAIQSALQWSYQNITSTTSFTSRVEDVWAPPCPWEKGICWEACTPAARPCTATQCLPFISVLVPGTIDIPSRCLTTPPPVPAPTAWCDGPWTQISWIKTSTTSTVTLPPDDCEWIGCTTITETDTVTITTYASLITTTTLEIPDNTFDALMLSETYLGCLPFLRKSANNSAVVFLRRRQQCMKL